MKRINKFLFYPSFAIITLLIISSCQGKKIPVDDPAARVADRWLTKAEVRRNIPAGLPESDSMRAATQFINNWVEQEAAMVVAERNIPDTEEINQLVENYRRELLMWEYRRRKIDENVSDPIMTDEQINKYLIDHEHSFILKNPVIKGIFIKIPEGVDELKEVRRIYISDRPDDIDRLDKILDSAVNYEYFRDHWVDWQQLVVRIPYEGFESDPDSYPLSHKNLDITFDGYVYLLHITEVVEPGKPMPASVAQPMIIEAIRRENAIDFDKTLRKLLTSEALADGTAQIF